MHHPNATMATSSLDRISGSQVSPISQPYNNFRVQTLGGNIVQGQINKIRVAEVLFPYGIPTIVAGQNDTFAVTFQTFTIGTGAGLEFFSAVSIPPGYYTGTELAAVIQTSLDTQAATFGGWPNGTIAVSFDTTNQAIVLRNTTVYDTSAGAVNYFFGWAPDTQVLPSPQVPTPQTFNNQDLTFTMGFRNYFSSNPALLVPGPSVLLNCIAPLNYPGAGTFAGIDYASYSNAVIGAQYTGRYTDWVDICSPTLCQAQFVRDGNTNQEVIRRDLICRLYISSEISTFLTDPVGSRPFVIHRQFKNAKVMKWTAERSIDAIDIQLYDMFGKPLPTPQLYVAAAPAAQTASSGAADFAITFLVDEPGAAEQSENIGYRY
jgi:hypothetical protein